MAKNSLMNVIENNDTLEISMYPRGVAGYIFTPQVDKDGNLSWTNNGGLTNPETVNIMGPRGPQGLIEFKIVDTRVCPWCHSLHPSVRIPGPSTRLTG